MKPNKIFFLAASLLLVWGFSSCFQDLEQDPPFNYPEQPLAPPYNPLKVYLPFDNSIEDGGAYKSFVVTSSAGSLSYPEGIAGQSYQGNAGNYVLMSPANVPGVLMLADTLTAMKGLTVAFWMNLPTEKAAGAQGIFSIPHMTKAWGNFDVFTDGNGSKVKVHLFNKRTGTLKDGWLDKPNTGVLDRWVHYAVRYEGATSSIDLFIDGELFVSNVVAGYGDLVFETPNSYILGDFGQNATPKLSTQDLGSWAVPFLGQLDQFRFYNVPLSDAAIKALFDNKE